MRLLSPLLLCGLFIWALPLPASDQVFAFTKSQVSALSTDIVQIAVNLLNEILICGSVVDEEGENSLDVYVKAEPDTSNTICRFSQFTAKTLSHDSYTNLVRRADIATTAHRLFPRPVVPVSPVSPDHPYDPVHPDPNTGFPESHYNGQSKGLSSGQMAGIIVGAILGAIILGLLIYYCIKQHRGEGSGGTHTKALEL